jgi:hypothetical protein
MHYIAANFADDRPPVVGWLVGRLGGLLGVTEQPDPQTLTAFLADTRRAM